MTQKEKAHDLLYKYLHSGKMYNTKVTYIGRGETQSQYNESIEIESAKQCALIAVDEILNTGSLIDEDVYVETPLYRQYWQEVKEEIEKL